MEIISIHALRTESGPTRKLQYFGSEIFENGRRIDSCFGTNSYVMLRTLLKITMYTADRKLQAYHENKNGKL